MTAQLFPHWIGCEHPAKGRWVSPQGKVDVSWMKVCRCRVCRSEDAINNCAVLRHQITRDGKIGNYQLCTFLHVDACVCERERHDITQMVSSSCAMNKARAYWLLRTSAWYLLLDVNLFYQFIFFNLSFISRCKLNFVSYKILKSVHTLTRQLKFWKKSSDGSIVHNKCDQAPQTWPCEDFCFLGRI